MTSLKESNKRKDAGLLIIRITTGVLFILAGLGKLVGGSMGPGLNAFSNMVWGSIIIATIVALVELVGGIGITIGYLNNISAILLALVIVGAILIVQLPMGNMSSILTNLSLLGTLVGLSMIGPGKYSLGKY